uniref:Uncharacterized protein n=1 Tax=Arundo donax TaxID=35708 RepID=A0A0A9DR80_ARUDO
MSLNSSKETSPSPLRSTPRIMRRHCATVAASPSPRSTRASSAGVMTPLPSASKTMKAWRRSSSTAAASAAAASMSAANSGRLMQPSPSASASSIMRETSSSVTAWPTLANSAASSVREICPSPFASNLRKTRSISSSSAAGAAGPFLMEGHGDGDALGGAEEEEEERRPLREKKERTLPMARFGVLVEGRRRGGCRR